MKSSEKDLPDYLLDLVEWSEKVARLTGRTNRNTIATDEQAELALARAVEIVGEIAGRLTVAGGERSKERFGTDLSNAYRLRNRLAHGYDNVSAEMLYDIATNNVPVLGEKARVWPAELPHDRP